MYDNEQGSITVWRPAKFATLEFKKGVAVRRPYPRHWHTEFQVCLIQGGAGDLCYKGSKHLTDEGKLFIIPPEEVHANQTREANGCSSLSFYFEPQFFARASRDISEKEISPTSFQSIVSGDKKLTQSLVKLHHSFETETSLLERETLLLEFFAELLIHCSGKPVELKKTGEEKSVVEKIKEVLLENFAENVSLGSLAEIANMSPFHFNRIFKKETGLPPHAFQNQVRVLRARTLLQQGLSIAHIAAETGFADQSHFKRHLQI